MLFLLVSLHEVEDIDGVHVEVQIGLGLQLLLELLREGLGPGFSSTEQIFNKFFGECVGCSFEDDTGTMLQHFLHLFLCESLILLSRLLLLNDKTIPFQFDHLSLDDLLFYCIFSDQSVYFYKPLLTDPMSSVHGLKVHLRVEIAIIDDNRICSSQVDP